MASDAPAFEAWPVADSDEIEKKGKGWWLHEWLLAGWGMPIGEFLDLEKLSNECERLNRWSFWFGSTPLHVKGGVASTVNGVAVL